MAVSRLGAGARGPHVIDGPASWAFDAQLKGRPFGQHLVAVSAPDLVVVCSLHFLIVLPLRPRIRPDMRLRARGLTVSRKRRRTLPTMPFHRVGPWSGVSPPGRWGRVQSPPPLPKTLCLSRFRRVSTWLLAHFSNEVYKQSPKDYPNIQIFL